MTLFSTIAARLSLPQVEISLLHKLGTGALLLLAGGAHAQALTITSLSPARNARSAARTTNVAASFSQALTTGSSTQQTLKVFSQQADGKKTGTASISGNTLTFDPTTDFNPGETVLATLMANAQSTSGTTATPHVFQFTTATTPAPGTFNGGSEVRLPTLNHSRLAVGDVDGDGDLDFVTTNTSNSSVSVRLNNGAASFSGTQDVAVGSSPLAIVLGDVDGDGDLDLLTTSLSANTVSVRLNNGAGTFGGGQEIGIGTVPQALTLGDLDGDGDLDLAVAATGDNVVSIRLNNGTGTFSGSTEVAVGNQPSSLALADLDTDGDLDLLALNYDDNSTVSVRLNTGTGSFNGTQEVAVGPTARDLAVGDVDGDGDLDLLAINSTPNSTVSVRLNNGAGTFGGTQSVAVGSNAETVVLGDVDGDGDLDLLATHQAFADATGFQGSNGVSVRLNNGSGAFSGTQDVPLIQPIGYFNSPLDLVLGDVDGDGDLDLLTSNSNNAVSVRLNQNPLPAFVSTTLLPVRNTLAAARTTPVQLKLNRALSTDLPTQSALKVFSAQSGGQKAGATVVNGNTLTFTPSVAFKPGETVVASLTGLALDPAGNAIKPEVFQFTTAVARSSGQFSSTPDVAVGAAPAGITLGDVNGDGRLDLLSANNVSNTISVRLNTGPGTFTSSQEVAVGPGNLPEQVALGDLDSDGDLDMVIATAGSPNINGTVSVRFNNGQGVFSGTAAYFVSYAPRRIVLGDIDGDGDLDFATANGTVGTVNVKLNDGKGVFIDSQRLSFNSSTADLAFGDIDSDGDLDMLVTTPIAQAVSILRNDGFGMFSASGTVAVQNPGSVVLGDVNGDGALDLLTGTTTAVRVHLNNGSGMFTSSQDVNAGGAFYSIAAGDVDGDGDLDLVASNYDSNVISLRLNNGTGTFTGTTTIAVGSSPYGVALGDLDGDGTLDLATANRNSNSASVRLNSQVLATVPAQLAEQVALYPNPAREAVQLRLPAELTRHSVQVRVLNTLGQVVLERNLAGQATQEVLLPQLVTGVYNVQLGTNQGVVNKRLLIK
ncbi:FG-GAP-like repeat-containing protein [Hymenobacter sp. GOD-10R]|uniref:FG-GAP-like repeat-containing protein n=1 Tax=Hymenobacter sp. GOD-10R TaxID=3093922 RepID=UPI002D76557C|nr:FG-GAP-like repeat-containing protein [Hymenobacter sp. GOD-10R]WRQ27033.1 FG-GAP-like repeat-containing protein [Hymenobacter sp. GOD-10R]